MLTVFSSTLQLYRDALHATGRSLVRGWFVILAVIVFTLLMMLAHQIARPLGMLGGFLLGAVNALLIGATLRPLSWRSFRVAWPSSTPRARCMTSWAAR